MFPLVGYAVRTVGGVSGLHWRDNGQRCRSAGLAPNEMNAQRHRRVDAVGADALRGVFVVAVDVVGVGVEADFAA